MLSAVPNIRSLVGREGVSERGGGGEGSGDSPLSHLVVKEADCIDDTHLNGTVSAMDIIHERDPLPPKVGLLALKTATTWPFLKIEMGHIEPSKRENYMSDTAYGIWYSGPPLRRPPSGNIV